MALLLNRKCEHCGRMSLSLRKTKRFCSTKCRVYRNREKLVSVTGNYLTVTDSVTTKPLSVTEFVIVKE